MPLQCCVIAALVALMVGAAPVTAFERSATLISAGDPGARDVGHVSFIGGSLDLRRILVETYGHLTPSDDEEVHGMDIFLVSGGRTTMLTGPTWEGTLGEAAAGLNASSPDGTAIVWSTEDPITADDVDVGDRCSDIYLTMNGRTSLLSTGPSRGRSCDDAHFGGASRDLRRIVFQTDEPLVPDDGDEREDVYLRSSGTTTLVSTTPGPFDAHSPEISADGRSVVFSSDGRITPSDTDDRPDMFEWRDGALRQVTIGPAGGNGPFAARLAFTVPPLEDSEDIAAIASDGRRAWFYTAEPMTVDDRDDRMDLYERGPAGVSRVSTGPAGGNGPYDVGEPDDREPGDPRAGRLMAVTPSGDRVFFGTRERLTRDDRDDDLDVYLRMGGRTVLVSKAGRGKTSGRGVALAGISRDGRRGVLSSRERLTRDDRDDSIDAFLWGSGALRRLSSGPRGGNRDRPYLCSLQWGCRRGTDVNVNFVSREADWFYFSTDERLTRDARKGVHNTYEHVAGKTTLVRIRGDRGRLLTKEISWALAGTTPDGRTLVISTTEPLARADDDDKKNDVYVTRVRSPRRRGT